LVLEDGSVKFEVGGQLMDVDLGAPCHIRHEVMAVNVEEGACLHFGKLWRRVVVTPPVESLLQQLEDEDRRKAG
jgi:hypothetical protein